MTPPTVPPTTLNTLAKTDFVTRLGGIFESSPWVAERVYPKRPFGDVLELHAAMCAEVAAAGPDAQLDLIRAHPDLAGKAALAGELTAASSREQAGAGLDRLNAEEYRRFHDLNNRYRERFGFPFVLEVWGHDTTSILAAFEKRLPNDADPEREAALEQIYKIARLRLLALTEAP